MGKMKVSLYVPCFNAEENIKACLEAILKQSFSIEEILVIDDGSTDKTLDIVSQFPVRIIRHSENEGLASVRNTAVKSAKGDFLASLDSDCIPEEGWLEELMKNFSSKTAGVGGRLLESSSDSIVDTWSLAHMRQDWGDNKTDSIPFLSGSNNVFIKKILFDVGGYDEECFNNYEDVSISKKIKKAGYALIYEPYARVHHARKNNFFSLLNRFWNWNFGYHKEKGYYKNYQGLCLKIKENIGLSNRFIEEDFAEKKFQLLYFDFLLSIHLTFKDLSFMQNGNIHSLITTDKSFYAFYLSLVDLSFFYRLDSDKKLLRTFVSCEDKFAQNFFVLLLLMGKSIKNMAGDSFVAELYKYLLRNFVKGRSSEADFLLKKLLVLVELRDDWSDFLKKEQANLEREVLREFVENFKKWFYVLDYHLPGSVCLIKMSQRQTIKEEGLK